MAAFRMAVVTPTIDTCPAAPPAGGVFVGAVMRQSVLIHLLVFE
jgi:hypothetical protein